MDSGPARKSVSRWQFPIQTTQMRSPRAGPHSAPVTTWTVRHSCLCAAHLVPSLMATATWVAQCDSSSQSALWYRPEPPCTTLASAALLCTRGRTWQWSRDRARLLRLACLSPIPRIIFTVLEAKVPGLVPGRPHRAQGQWSGCGLLCVVHGWGPWSCRGLVLSTVWEVGWPRACRLSWAPALGGSGGSPSSECCPEAMSRRIEQGHFIIPHASFKGGCPGTLVV